ncbi:hypothetical protein H9Y04_36205 [Streptomyces sp. TRM66268-LWL]|uniref:DNA methylase adenine-specific domain-containing protein n=1 Tax=Streptomyces polyasparticus TaxID=2767826 RepID=A0ABR7SR55_9ACTN|nr:hypothetical protein [Streptomyces polyasparticus]MBC9717990.1 hypothetical protein [Streptomyces polyasparticus]
MTSTREAAGPTLPEGSSWRISYSEIGALAQVQRPVVTTWARRHGDFPKPVAYAGASPLFDGADVADWLLTTGRGNADARQIQAELVLYTLSALRQQMPARLVVDAVTALICLRHQLDTAVAALPWGTLMAQAEEIDTEDRFLLQELRSIPDADRQGPMLATLADQLTEAAYSPAEAVEWVMGARRRLGCDDLTAGEPMPLVTTALARLSGIADEEEGEEGLVVAVPYSRSGDLLLALQSQSDPETRPFYLSADPVRDLARLARRRMLVRGVYEIEMELADGETLDTDEWGYPRIVVCVLPYEAAEARTPLGVLQQIQNLTRVLEYGCVAIVLGPADALVGPLPPRGEADRLRRSFLTNHLLKAVVSMPEGVFPSRPAHRTAIWVLSRTPKAQRTGLVMLADLAAQPLTESVLNALVEDVEIFRAGGWRSDGRHDPRHGVILNATALSESPGVAFRPQHRPHASRFTRDVIERPARISDLELRLQQLVDATLSELSAAEAIRTHAVLRSDDRPARRTTVVRLIKERRLRRLPGHRIAAEHLSVPGGHYTVLTPEEIVGSAPVGGRRMDRAVVHTMYEHAEFTEPGDVVVTATPSFGAYVDDEGLSVVAFPARVLRVRSDAENPIRPRVLAAVLRAAAAEHERVPGAVRASRRIEELLIPDLSDSEAQRYEALLVDIARRTALLRQQAAALDDLAAMTADGLIDGTLTITDPTLS